VNKKYRMTAQRKDLATFTIIIGVLTLVLAVSALAEKAHEEHLPERNGRGTAEAIIASGFPVGILILLSAVSGFVRFQHRCRNKSGGMTPPRQSCRMARDTDFAMQWPMRLQS
jgi:hypothetical protein